MVTQARPIFDGGRLSIADSTLHPSGGYKEEEEEEEERIDRRHEPADGPAEPA